MDKKALRKAMMERRKNIPQEERKEKSNRIKERLFSLELFKKANFIFTFISTEEEVDTHEIIKESINMGKRIGVPITLSKEKRMMVSEIQDFASELEIGYYNILTPKKEYIREVDPEEIDMVLVPGLIFREDGYRIGYGGGYYDRFLGGIDSVIKIGLCYEMQLSEDIPIDTYDIPVNYIITEERLIDCKGNKK
ncbi:MAG: 5-formyltetrahydrofolate cyclo-ligase [Tissierellia bacterium]|nr:5-formyltetrahydrofolate cyclo-ligase [Tissierellia bacterium]